VRLRRMLLLAQLLCTRRARLRLIIARMVTRKQFPDAFLWPSREGVDLHIAVIPDSSKWQVSDHRITADEPAGLPPVAGDTREPGNDQCRAELGDFQRCYNSLHLVIIS
jgi:hypothetical protein